eukprot:1671943-Rhodomonas_salina.6
MIEPAGHRTPAPACIIINTIVVVVVIIIITTIIGDQRRRAAPSNQAESHRVWDSKSADRAQGEHLVEHETLAGSVTSSPRRSFTPSSTAHTRVRSSEAVR